jgi:4-hydroxy-tetrahydrodipicolinate synthase
MMPLIRTLFIETNPIPVKQALAFMGRCVNELRMPLCQMSAPAADRLRTAMKELKLI